MTLFEHFNIDKALLNFSNDKFFTMIAVSSLPGNYGNFEGAKCLPTPSNDGVYLTNQYYFYELTCTSNSCSWSIMDQQLSQFQTNAVMMYLPADYTCTKTTTTASPTTIITTTTTTATTTTNSNVKICICIPMIC